ncbi:MAG: SusD/RagB family nutrient-binding outer membrane lipoprotein, partial [Chitinophagaceae bacterium]|nr:SusD/RagB family nutrient-binding outer membrane lipoprotein [Chitinophagaceae bacterium]
MKSDNKLIRLIAFGLVFSLGIGWAGCTKNFEERNTSPSGLTSLSATDIKAFFPTVVYNGLTLAYQTGQNLAAGMYSQYYSCTQVAFASHRYVMNQQWWASTWNGLFVNVMSPLRTIISQTEDQPTMNAIARIWRVMIFHRYTDYFGPLPWSQMGNFVPGEGIPYDSQQDIYNALFNELSQAISTLQSNLSVPSFGSTNDYIYQGDNAKWLKFANSLRLRMAMRISFVDPAKAKTEAEAAVAGGVMEDPGDDAFMEAGASHRNYLAYISAWNEFRMSANFESLFKGYNDPRMPKYFSPTVADGVFRGGRAGLVPGEQTVGYNRYDWLSDLGPYYRPDIAFTSPFNVMYAAESYFLRAEGVLNGWNMGGGT